MRYSIFAAAALLFSMPLAAQEMDAAAVLGEKEDQEITDLLPKSMKSMNQTWKVPKDCDSFVFNLKLVNPGIVRIFFESKGGKKTKPLIIRPFHQSLQREKSDDELGRKTTIEIAKPDEVFQNQGIQYSYEKKSIQRFVQPCFLRYTPDNANKQIAHWDDIYPTALTCTSHLEFRPGPQGLRFYADGLFMFDMPDVKDFQTIRITGGTGAVVTGAKVFADKPSPFFEALDMKYAANPGVMKGAEPSLKPGLQQVEGVPMIVGSGKASADLSLVDGLRGMNFVAENDYYMQRTSWERHECTQQWAVPSNFYHEAYILFALDPDPEKDRAFSFRLGRFSDGGRCLTGWAYMDVFLPDAGAPMPENIREVGKVRFNGKEIPLYLGTFPIDIGSIVQIPTNDVNAGRRGFEHMDFDIMGRRAGSRFYIGTSHRPDPKKKSAVNVFGITLRKSGVWVYPEQKEPGNIFYNDEKPETSFKFRAERPGKFTVTWRIFDTTGKTELKKGVEEYTFSKAGEEKTLTLDLAQKDVGHYTFKIEIAENGKTLYTHPGSFALLGKDTRLASCAESPFGAWYTPSHGGTSDPDVYLKIFHKAGIRRPSGLFPYDYRKKLIPELLKKYKEYNVTLNQIPWLGVPPCSREEDPEKFEAYMRENFEPWIQVHPNTKYALIFHESYGDDPVPERFGIKGEVTEKDEKYTRYATDVAEWYRRNHPDIKLVYGNNTSSSALTAALMRGGFNTEYLDFIGIETPGQGCIPERLWQGGTQGTFIAQEVAKTWGVNAKVTGCYEFVVRPGRLFDNRQIQAAYFMRDALIGLAYGFETLGISGLQESDNWYMQTVWGGDGSSLCGVTPLLYPNPIIASYAAMTRALDRIKFRPVSRDTGNLSCYALEFERKEGGYVYALWVPRGTSEVRFDFPSEIQGTHIEFFGVTTPRSGKTLTLTASEYPQYLITPVKADAVKHLRTISPEPPKDWKPSVVFEKLADFRQIPAPRSLKQDDLGVRPGKFNIREVNDPEKGRCLEFELIREGTVPVISPEYTRIEFKEPIPLAGTPDELGLWVCGDGGWGKIGFEVQDARGLRFRNEGPWADFSAKSYFNFKGWYFMTYPITGQGLRRRRTQSLGGEWSVERPGQLPMVYPLKLLGLHITLRRKMLNPAEMTDAPCVIRIRELGAISNPEFQPPK